MNFSKLNTYTAKPSLYQTGTSVMWTDPHISRQLLPVHLDPDSDLASRSTAKIELVVNWVLQKTKPGTLDIIDLGCGPGLYTERLAALGHRVTGVDFSENSIAYATKMTAQNGSNIAYHCKNYLDIEFVAQFDLAIMIFLDFCVLKPHERAKVLDNIFRALKPGGIFIFDVVNSRNIQAKVGTQNWQVSPDGGFWKANPYMELHQGFHYPEHKTIVEQHIVIDEQDKVDTYLFWSTYYDYDDLAPILNQAGFGTIQNYENVLPAGDIWGGDTISFYIAKKELT